MPTGYTAPLHEGDVSFEEFVWRCARAFSAFIMMRDDPMDAPLSTGDAMASYHEQALKAELAKLAELQAMDPESVAYVARMEHETALARHDEALTKHRRIVARVTLLLRQAEQWMPPSTDHVGLKDFMVEQLRTDLRHLHEPKPPGPLSPEAWLTEKKRLAMHMIEYHTRERDGEMARAAERRLWASTLAESVPVPDKLQRRF